MNATYRRYYIWPYLLIFCSQPLFLNGQEEVFHFHRLAASDNLISQGFNYFISRDEEGFIWIPSLYGVNQFDGREVKQHLPIPGDSTKISDGLIQSRLFLGKEGEVWFNTSEALHRYRKAHGDFQQYVLKIEGETLRERWELLHYDTLANEFWVLLDSVIWICASLENNSWRLLDTIPTYYDEGLQLIDLPEKQSKLLLLPQRNGWHIRKYKNGRKEKEISFPPTNENRSGFTTYSFFFESEKRLWVGTNAGLAAYSLEREELDFVIDNFQGDSILRVVDVYAGGENKLVVASEEKGLFFFDTESGQFVSRIYSNENGVMTVFPYTIDKIFVDRDKNLWVSTEDQGVFFTNLNNKKFASPIFNKTLGRSAQSNIKAIAEDKEGNLWCLTWEGLKIIDENGKPVAKYKRFEGKGRPFAEQDPFYIFCDTQDRIWLCTKKGLYVLKDTQGEFEEVVIQPISNRRTLVIYISELSNGQMLASTFQSGIFELEGNSDPEKEFIIRRPDKIPNTTETYSISYESKQGFGVVSNELNSLLIFKIEEDALIPDTTINFNSMVSAFADDVKRSCVWVGTALGLYRLNKVSNAYELQQASHFPSLPINGLLQDSLGYLWATTTNGLFKYHPDSSAVKKFNLSDGLVGMEFNSFSYLETNNSQFIFGSKNGLTVFNPYGVESLAVQARPILTEIKINNLPADSRLACKASGATNISEMQHISLPYRENDLFFRFAALEYSDPGASRFQYFMEGLDNDWRPPIVENFAQYPPLKPGTYFFRVKAANSDDLWSNEEAKLKITIRPPWWKTRLFYFFCFLTFLVIVYSIYRFRVNQVKKKEAFLRKEAEYKKLVAENRTAVLRLQMNPHFIFNSMNSISSFILKEDIDSAYDYLGMFAALIRKILDLSEKHLISLSEEIELLEQYLDIESLRLPDKFEYDFILMDQIDPYETRIPTMILQPFVENAIWHGVSRKKNQGLIKIAFEKKGDQLWCSVEDNGVGRSSAAQFQKKQKKHESKASSITEQRLELLANDESPPSSLEIIDLVDDKGRAAGTKVILKIPLL